MNYSINKSEVKRYLGIKGEADDVTEKLIDECMSELTEVVRPKYIYRIFKIERTDKNILFSGCSLSISSYTASERLCGCEYCALLGATLGIEADNKIRLAQSINMAKAVIYDACAADLIEKVCDRAQAEIASDAEKDNLLITERFSPGYGDLPLDTQRDIFSILNLPITIGVSLTDELLLIPAKSVTAFIGIGSNVTGKLSGCHSCNMKCSCKYCKINPKGK